MAINKCDKPDANPDRVRQELTEYGVIPEEWGGENMFVNVSARSREGIDNLLETILLQADMLELKANPNPFASGYVIEASWTRAAARWRPCSCKTARCMWATSSSPAQPSAACAP